MVFAAGDAAPLGGLKVTTKHKLNIETKQETIIVAFWGCRAVDRWRD